MSAIPPTLDGQSTLDRLEFPPYARMFAAMHDAMRRDADRLVAAVDGAADEAADVAALARWFGRFEAVIEHHHRCEDEIVWPGLVAIIDRGDCGDEGAAFLAAHHALLDDHEELDDAMGAVRVALHAAAGTDRRLDAAERFRTCLDRHLAREEAALFPLLSRHVSEADFLKLEEAVVKSTPMSAMTFTVPWIIDGASADLVAEILSGLPLPIRIADRWLLQPRYRRIVAAAFGARS